MTDDVLMYQTSGALATVTMNRPKQFNALNKDLRRALREVVEKIATDDAVRVVIFKGSGPGFCAGADLTDGVQNPVSLVIEQEYKPALVGIAESDKIWIAQIHGTAAGIGAAFAMNCDLVTMADNASVYMAFAAISLIPDGGNTWLLLNQMGYHRAMQAILEGEKISAADCLKYGIANKLFAPEELDAGTREWAEKLANGAPLAMAAAKRLLRKVGHMTYSEAISDEGMAQNPLLVSEDFTTGVKAFFAKEKPVFSGR